MQIWHQLRNWKGKTTSYLWDIWKILHHYHKKHLNSEERHFRPNLVLPVRWSKVFCKFISWFPYDSDYFLKKYWYSQCLIKLSDNIRRVLLCHKNYSTSMQLNDYCMLRAFVFPKIRRKSLSLLSKQVLNVLVGNSGAGPEKHGSGQASRPLCKRRRLSDQLFT